MVCPSLFTFLSMSGCGGYKFCLTSSLVISLPGEMCDDGYVACLWFDSVMEVPNVALICLKTVMTERV